MKRRTFLIILFPVCGICNGQNLVPNGNFEQFAACPSYYGQIDSALFWINPNEGTPDYFNQCSSFGNTSTPINGIGWENPHSGVAYGGISLFGLQSKEYIETPLTSPLIANEQYHFEMFASLGDRSFYTTDAIQVYFSDTLVANVDSFLVLPFTPQISNDSGVFLNDANWTLISGNYTAHGGESYLIIGNFKHDSLTAVQINGSVFGTAYSYIDDVSLTVITSSNSQIEVENMNLFPNPFNDHLNIHSNIYETSELILYDITLSKLLQQSFSNSITINTEQLAKGIYLYEVRNINGMIKKGKVVKD